MFFQRKAISNKDITIINVASYMINIDINLVCPTTNGKSKANLV